ncbi:hypothetical protein AB833_02115 [Chromatiales bacterium (ex Bugula neritina AB1)]|nr:hypothetical protein AB833_02115 [Chromatiales bacterium (ex Bugula neritina AB1)]
MNIQSLFKYKRWADDLLYTALLQLPEHELGKDRPMLFGNILALLNHIYAMDLVWHSNLTGSAHGLKTRNPDDVPIFSELREKQIAINTWYQNYTTTIQNRELEEPVYFTFIGGGKSDMQKGEILQHVVNHDSYHRGHIEGVMYQISAEPPTTDIPVFLREIQSTGQR